MSLKTNVLQVGQSFSSIDAIPLLKLPNAACETGLRPLEKDGSFPCRSMRQRASSRILLVHHLSISCRRARTTALPARNVPLPQQSLRCAIALQGRLRGEPSRRIPDDRQKRYRDCSAWRTYAHRCSGETPSPCDRASDEPCHAIERAETRQPPKFPRKAPALRRSPCTHLHDDARGIPCLRATEQKP